MDTSRDYFLLLLDIRRSTRMAPERLRVVMERLERVASELSRQFEDELELALNLSYGDEVAGLFRRPDRTYDCVIALREAVAPDAALRFVISEGRIGLVSDDIRRIGGAVFKAADEEMKNLKRQRQFATWLLADQKTSAVLTSLSRLSNLLVENMTDYQRTVYQLMRDGLSGSEIASRLGKYPQSVSEAAKRGGADLVIEAETTITRVLSTEREAEGRGADDA